MTSDPSHNRVIAVVGPTAVGKTALAEELAVRLGGEIVSADSMQIYRGMDVGTAKPPLAERRVAYHCLDIAEPGEPYSAQRYQLAARAAIDDCLARGVVPIVCGGTGLYVRAALDDMNFVSGDSVGSESREAYETLAAEQGSEQLFELLRQRDPRSADVLHPNNVRRVIRALEMADAGGSYSDQVAGFTDRRSIYPTAFIGLQMERAQLYDRINARVDEMMRAGLLGEVSRLLDAGLREAITAAQAIGYKELVPVVEGTSDLESALDAIKMASRRYAKRQMTWFRSDPRIVWLDATETVTEQLADAAEAAIIGLPIAADKE